MTFLSKEEQSELATLQRKQLEHARREEARLVAEVQVEVARKARGSTARKIAKGIAFGFLFVIGGFLAIIMIAVVAS